MQKPWSPWRSCGNRCLMSIRENLKRLVVCLAFCCRCLCFYCRGIHGSLMNRGPISDGLKCPRYSRLHIRIMAILGISHMLWGSAASSPPHVFSVFIPFQASYSNNRMSERRQGGKYWVLGWFLRCHSRCSLSGPSLTPAAHCVSHRHRGEKKTQIAFLAQIFFVFFRFHKKSEWTYSR